MILWKPQRVVLRRPRPSDGNWHRRDDWWGAIADLKAKRYNVRAYGDPQACEVDLDLASLDATAIRTISSDASGHYRQLDALNALAAWSNGRSEPEIGSQDWSTQRHLLHDSVAASIKRKITVAD
jgi:hypothetical protein